MNLLIVGANTKMAKVFSNFANVIILSEKTNFRLYDDILEFKVIKAKSDISKPVGILGRIFELRRIIKVCNIDVIFTNDKISMIAAYITNFITKKNIILLSTSHNSYAWTNKKKVRVFSKIINICTHGYISLSSHVTNLLIENSINPKKILTTANPIEQDVFKVKRNYLINGIVSIVYVAVIYKGKGHDVLLKSINNMNNNGFDVEIHFYGDILEKSYYDELLDYIRQNKMENYVHFHGKIENSDLRNILNKYDIYVCPSEMEMSPYNLIEAKAAALPVIASNVGGIPDIVSNYKDGILVEPGSPYDLMVAIQLVITDCNMREDLGKNAYLSSKTKHSPQNISKNIQNFITYLNA